MQSNLVTLQQNQAFIEYQYANTGIIFGGFNNFSLGICVVVFVISAAHALQLCVTVNEMSGSFLDGNER